MPDNDSRSVITSSCRTRLPGRMVLAVAALPLVLGAVDIAQDSIFGLPPGVRLARLIPGVLVYYLLLGALAPLVHRLVGWSLDIDRSPLPVLGAHVAVLPVFVLLHLVITTAAQRWIVPHEPDFGLHLANMARMFAMCGVIWYVVLATSFHSLLYYLRGQESELAAARFAARLAEARMAALGARLRPHFLFNTLSTIGALAERGDTEEVVEVVHDLGDLLREVRRDGTGSTTTVAHEETLLMRYLRILRVRFGSRLSVEVDIEDAARNGELPVFTLQMLTENAVKHGYRARSDGLAVEVHVHRLDARLEVRVGDSGPGFPDDQERPAGGLSNLEARLQALYGSEFTLAKTRSSLGGAEVLISVPYRPVTPPTSPERPHERA